MHTENSSKNIKYMSYNNQQRASESENDDY